MSSPGIIVTEVRGDRRRVADALAVLREALGQEFISDAGFRRYVTPRAGRPYRGALAALDEAGGAVVGALTVEIVTARTLRASFLDSYRSARAVAEVRALSPGRTGLIKSIAVAPAWRGRGVAAALLGRGLAGLAAHGAEAYYALAWERLGGDCPLRGPLEAAGFHGLSTLERFWYADSIVHGYVCPACGHPCVCSARLMIRWGESWIKGGHVSD